MCSMILTRPRLFEVNQCRAGSGETWFLGQSLINDDSRIFLNYFRC